MCCFEPVVPPPCGKQNLIRSRVDSATFLCLVTLGYDLERNKAVIL